MRIRATGHSNTTSNTTNSHNKSSIVAGRVRFEAIVPNMTFTVVQLHPIPVLATPLSKLLTNPAQTATEASLGYVTMNQTRKLVFLLETDPSVSLVQMVGVWVQLPYSQHSNSSNDSNNTNCDMDVQHPFVWAACVRYLCSDAVKQRVYVDSHTFLLVRRKACYFMLISYFCAGDVHVAGIPLLWCKNSVPKFSYFLPTPCY